jgi:hypothetical protein
VVRHPNHKDEAIIARVAGRITMKRYGPVAQMDRAAVS